MAKMIKREYSVILTVVIFIVVVIAWPIHSVLSVDPYLIGLTSNMTTFDSHLWKEGRHREDMVLNLLFMHKLIGLTHEEVTALLGEQQAPLDPQLLPEYRLPVMLDYYLMITYNHSGRVSKVRIGYCGS